MVVELVIPKDLMDYFEYIPEKTLPKIILSMLRESLEAKQTTGNGTESNAISADELLHDIVAKLQGAISSGSVIPTGSTQALASTIAEVPVPVVNKSQDESISWNFVDLGDDEDLSGFTDMLK